MIRTARLRLVPARPEHYAAMRAGDVALGRLLGVDVAEGWVGLEDHRAAITGGDAGIAEHPEWADWWTYLFITEAVPTLIGVGGLKGAPTDGLAGLGYALAPGWRGQGLALEAARGLIDFTLARPEVNEVQAQTLPEENDSTRLLRRLGMTLRETVVDPDDDAIWRWSLLRGPS